MRYRRCQLLLDPELWDRLKAEADRSGLSISALVRQRLTTIETSGSRAGPSSEADREQGVTPAEPVLDHGQDRPTLLRSF